MKQKNCPNCGAAYEINTNKCPYCGTSYFDLSAIDMGATEPFYLKIKYNNMIITQLVKPEMGTSSITINSDRTYAHDGRGNKVASFTSNQYIGTELKFHSVVDNKGQIFTLEVEE